MSGRSQEASLQPPIWTHHLPREGARTDLFFQERCPHDTYLKMVSASRGIILSHLRCGTSAPPPPPSSAVGPLGPRHVSSEGGGGIGGGGGGACLRF